MFEVSDGMMASCRATSTCCPRPVGALVQRGQHAGEHVGARHEVDDRRPGADRRPVREAGGAHDGGARLDGQIHRRLAGVGAERTEAGARGHDQARVELHSARHIPDRIGPSRPGTGSAPARRPVGRASAQHLLSGRVLEVQPDGALARVHELELDRRAVVVSGGEPPVRIALGASTLMTSAPRRAISIVAVRGEVELPDADHLHALAAQSCPDSPVSVLSTFASTVSRSTGTRGTPRCRNGRSRARCPTA